MIDIRWDPLKEREPVVPECPLCGGRKLIPENAWNPTYPCPSCSATGRAQSPVCGECGGSGQIVCGSRWEVDCTACSGSGHAPWGVLVTVDVFKPVIRVKGEVGNGGFGIPVVTDDDLATLFATIAAHPEMQFHLPLETVASAERAREWMEAGERAAVDVSAYRDTWDCRQCGKENPADSDGMGMAVCVCGGHEDDEIAMMYPASVWSAMNKAKRIVIDRWPLKNLTLLAVAHDQPSLDEVLPAVLAVPAAAHGVWLRALDGAVDLPLDWRKESLAHFSQTGHGDTEPQSECVDCEQPRFFYGAKLSILLLDDVGDMPKSDSKAMNWWASQVIWGNNAAAQAREAGVSVVAV